MIVLSKIKQVNNKQQERVYIMNDLFIEESDITTSHTITSKHHLCCSDTGRVMAVFYNKSDIDNILQEMKNDKTQIASLKSMIDNGIGWKDLENECT
tara:strand:+ start:38929 stop:39219 length:291 start_codon:yes stop_codon:yes gene_type:complete